MGKRTCALVLTVAALLTSASPARAEGEHDGNRCEDLTIEWVDATLMDNDKWFNAD